MSFKLTVLLFLPTVTKVLIAVAVHILCSQAVIVLWPPCWICLSVTLGSRRYMLRFWTAVTKVLIAAAVHNLCSQAVTVLWPPCWICLSVTLGSRRYMLRFWTAVTRVLIAAAIHNLCNQANCHCIMATMLNMPLSYFGQQAIHVAFLNFIQLSLPLHQAFCSLFQ